jgi:Tol biopolymer transport system component
MHPNWSPDGQTIVFSSDRTGHFELYMANVKGGVATRLTFTQWTVDNLEPAWSPDGTMIAFVRHEWNMFPEISLVPDGFDLHAQAHLERDASDVSDHVPGHREERLPAGMVR